VPAKNLDLVSQFSAPSLSMVHYPIIGRSIGLATLAAPTYLLCVATEDGEFIGETRMDPNRDNQPKGDGFR
jgi:hypothetical protein